MQGIPPIWFGSTVRGGEIFALEMGEPARIAEMARDLVRLSGLEPGRDTEIVYTGLRPGEKLAEELRTGTEDLETTTKDKLLVIRRPEAEAASLPRLLGQMETLERLAKAGDRVVPPPVPSRLAPPGGRTRRWRGWDGRRRPRPRSPPRCLRAGLSHAHRGHPQRLRAGAGGADRPLATRYNPAGREGAGAEQVPESVDIREQA